MKPFDIKTAKNGDAVLLRRSSNGVVYDSAVFIGAARTGEAVVESANGCICVADVERLRTPPKIVEGAVNVYRNEDGVLYLTQRLHETYSLARARALAGNTPNRLVGTASVRWEE